MSICENRSLARSPFAQNDRILKRFAPRGVLHMYLQASQRRALGHRLSAASVRRLHATTAELDFRKSLQCYSRLALTASKTLHTRWPLVFGRLVVFSTKGAMRKQTTQVSLTALRFLAGFIRLLPARTRFWVTRKYLASRGDQKSAELIGLISEYIDEDWYLRVNPDVAASSLGPVAHFVRHGLMEGRRPSPGTTCHFSVPRPGELVLGKFCWHGRDVWLCKAKPLPHAVVRQIQAQASHDPAVSAPGILAIPNLRQIDASDLLVRNGVNVGALFSGISQKPSVVVIVGMLGSGSAEKYAADIAGFLADASGGPPLIIVTGQSEAEAQGWEDLASLQPLKRCRLLFWRETCRPARNASQILARLLNGLRASHIFVVNSEVGFEAISTHGRGLSQYSRIHCVFLHLGLGGIGVPDGVQYARRTLPFATALTDNEPVAEILRKRYAGLPGLEIEVLPPRLTPCAPEVFSVRMEDRACRTTVVGGHRWLWISRLEFWSGTSVLSALAKMRPADSFHLYGSLHAPLQALSLDLPNITYHGDTPDLGAADFSGYDGFILTSFVSGMPSIALDMSQHAIPMVIVDIGGIRTTYDDSAAIFVPYASSPEDAGNSFHSALERLECMDQSAVLAMIVNAREQALACHSPEVFQHKAATIIRQASSEVGQFTSVAATA